MCFSGHHWVSVLVRRGVGPQVNKFEQVSHDNHQVSVAGRKGEGVGTQVLGRGGGAEEG